MDKLEMDMNLLKVFANIKGEIIRLTAIRECIIKGDTTVPPEYAIELSITQLKKAQAELKSALDGLKDLK